MLKITLSLKPLFVFACCLVSISVPAQNQFVVYSTIGEVTMIEKKKQILVKAGQIISADKSITIAGGSGITLIGKDSTTLSLTSPGVYLLSSFSDSFQKSDSKLLGKFIKYLWDVAARKQAGQSINIRRYYFDYHVRTGPLNNVWIDRRCFDTTNYSGVAGNFGFHWRSYVNAKEYEFSLYAAPNAGTPFYKTTTRELRMPFTSLDSHIKPGNSYYWTANLKGEDETDLYVLNYVTKETYDQLLTTIRNQRPLIEGPSEEAYRIAFMLEYSHYMAEAYQHYIKAANLDSKNALYSATLASFRRDFNLK